MLLAIALAGGLAAALAELLGGGGPLPLLIPRAALGARDPLAFAKGQENALERAASFGLAHVLYENSPGGVLATARRTARFRPLVERAVKGSGISPDTLEAIVFLESAGQADVIAGPDPAAAAGLTQILAETGRNFLHMRVDLPASRRLTREIAAAAARGDQASVDRLRARRRRVDARFDPGQALAATVRYLLIAEGRSGRTDLAVASYHMGIGNLESVLRDFAGAPLREPIRAVVAHADLSWPRLYFDSSPLRHTSTWQQLASFGDDSQTYYWRVLASKEIMRLFRSDPGKLEQLAALQTSKASAEDVLHPAASSDRFRSPADIKQAWQRRELQPLPNQPIPLYLRIDPKMGELAPRLGQRPTLYRGLRPEALALLLYLAQRVHALSGAATPLTVTSTVRDDNYQRMLTPSDPEATTNYSLHTTGFAFDIRRRYSSPAQAAAFQYELERLQALNLIAWIREPQMIHITVSPQAQTLVPAMLQKATPAGRR